MHPLPAWPPKLRVAWNRCEASLQSDDRLPSHDSSEDLESSISNTGSPWASRAVIKLLCPIICRDSVNGAKPGPRGADRLWGRGTQHIRKIQGRGDKLEKNRTGTGAGGSLPAGEGDWGSTRLPGAHPTAGTARLRPISVNGRHAKLTPESCWRSIF